MAEATRADHLALPSAVGKGTGTAPIHQGEPVVFVTIGRNVGLEPMSRQKWQSFREAMRAALQATVGMPDFEIVGLGGKWNDVAEMAAVFVVLGPAAALGGLREQLARLAVDYGQQAIAFAVGCSELIGPNSGSSAG